MHEVYRLRQINCDGRKTLHLNSRTSSYRYCTNGHTPIFDFRSFFLQKSCFKFSIFFQSIVSLPAHSPIPPRLWVVNALPWAEQLSPQGAARLSANAPPIRQRQKYNQILKGNFILFLYNLTSKTNDPYLSKKCQ